ncbi:uncharacterized protein LOC141850753 [Brevipalpus obovatus]|uniref:uncharacterized protein LOC141850753 n=1 Tax=Brevipalpus obovatus TaxID=246614 RepID=UPI003D9EF17C
MYEQQDIQSFPHSTNRHSSENFDSYNFVSSLRFYQSLSANSTKMVIAKLDPLLEKISKFFYRFGKEYLFLQKDNGRGYYCVCYNDGHDDVNHLITLLVKIREEQLVEPMVDNCKYAGETNAGPYPIKSHKLLASHYLDYHPRKLAQFFYHIVNESDDQQMKTAASEILLSWKEREEERHLEDFISGVSSEDIGGPKAGANFNSPRTLKTVRREPENIISHVDVSLEDDSDPVVEDAEMCDQEFLATSQRSRIKRPFDEYSDDRDEGHNDPFSSPGKIEVARPANFPSRDGSNFARPGPTCYGRGPVNQRSTQPRNSGYSTDMSSSEDKIRQRMNQQAHSRGNDIHRQDRGGSSFSRPFTGSYQHRQGLYQ